MVPVSGLSGDNFQWVRPSGWGEAVLLTKRLGRMSQADMAVPGGLDDPEPDAARPEAAFLWSVSWLPVGL